ncbi:serine O-acetyltransferase [Lichenihabitans psoromatis]|uniref:serine O-acetyltransferase n=1 Tax=Lichenihabitans psoromatis TaxID=2528642 RepID=UPI0010368C9C|nr:serine O-acetyltransferase [Lichenihabitans psoromatis]
MDQRSSAKVIGLPGTDPLFDRVRNEAEAVLRNEPELAGLMLSTVLNHDDLAGAVVHRIAARLDHPDVPGTLLRQVFTDLVTSAGLQEAFAADLLAVAERDPACTKLIQPLLYFKGFHAIQTHRMAHALWKAGRQDLALYIQSRSSSVFQTDIHPAAVIGKGLFLDHATGLVVGSTAVIEDDVSMLQDVTLGGTGKQSGDRHPKIRHGVLIGAGAKVLGNIEVGHCSRVAAGSVVLQPVPPKTTVAGVPARVVGEAGCAEPARSMEQRLQKLDRGGDA